MNKYILLTTFLLLSACGNIHTPEVSQTGVNNSENVRNMNHSPEINQIQKFAEDKIIVYFYWTPQPNGDIGDTLQRFYRLEDFYNFIPTYRENLQKWEKFRMKYFIIEAYGLFGSEVRGKIVSETRDAYSDEVLQQIFEILWQYPDVEKSVEIQIDPPFLENPEILSLYEKFHKPSN